MVRYDFFDSGFLIVLIVVKNNQVGICFVKSHNTAFQQFRLNEIITVNKTEIRSACQLHSRIAGITETAVLFMQDLNSGILLCIVIQDTRTFIGCAVIHQNQFKILPGLRQNGINTARQIGRDVIDRDNNRNLRHGLLPCCV